jgi:hypothetical protein
MTITAEQVSAALQRLAVPPSASHRQAAERLRQDGLTFGDAVVREGLRCHRIAAGLDPETGMAPSAQEWVTRSETQRRLGLSRARVDNLRRSGALDSRRNPHTGRVRVSVTSINRLLTIRSGVDA